MRQKEQGEGQNPKDYLTQKGRNKGQMEQKQQVGVFTLNHIDEY